MKRIAMGLAILATAVTLGAKPLPRVFVSRDSPLCSFV